MKNSNMFSRNRFMNEKKKKKKLQFCSCPKWGILNFPGTGNTELEERLTPASDLMNLFCSVRYPVLLLTQQWPES